MAAHNFQSVYTVARESNGDYWYVGQLQTGSWAFWTSNESKETEYYATMEAAEGAAVDAWTDQHTPEEGGWIGLPGEVIQKWYDGKIKPFDEIVARYVK